MAKSQGHSVEKAAEFLAVEALSWLAADPEEFGGFLALAGIGPAEVREAAKSPGFLAGVLDHLLANEPLLIAFAIDRGMKPASVAAARRALDDLAP